MYFDVSEKIYYLSDYFIENNEMDFDRIKLEITQKFKLNKGDFLFRILFEKKSPHKNRLIISYEQFVSHPFYKKVWEHWLKEITERRLKK